MIDKGEIMVFAMLGVEKELMLKAFQNDGEGNKKEIKRPHLI
jgi:hypothetical protein